MRLATWNVNSLNVRLPRALAWLAKHQPDVLALQELKLETDKFPYAEIEAAGYHAIVSGQKTYNGVALLSKIEGQEIVTAVPGLEDEQRRVVAATFGDVRVIGLYVVNGQALDSEKFIYKKRWLAAVTDWLADEAKRHPKLAVMGDFNIAPTDADVHDPAAWAGQVLCTDHERAVFQSWLDLGLVDSFRKFDHPPKTFSWWDYRMLGFQKNLGLRIDHILLSPPLAEACTSCKIDRDERKGEKPSDHAPVMAELLG